MITIAVAWPDGTTGPRTIDVQALPPAGTIVHHDGRQYVAAGHHLHIDTDGHTDHVLTLLPDHVQQGTQP